MINRMLRFKQKVKLLQQSLGERATGLPTMYTDGITSDSNFYFERLFNVLQIFIIFAQQGLDELVVFK